MIAELPIMIGIPVPPAKLPQVETAALEWFEGLAKVLGPAMERRDITIAAAPAVLAALGAFGHTLVGIQDADMRAAERERRLEQLRNVNWEKGPLWEGIAGKFTPKGEFSIGGPKEMAYAIYTALSDPQSPAYSRVRLQPVPA